MEVPLQMLRGFRKTLCCAPVFLGIASACAGGVQANQVRIGVDWNGDAIIQTQPGGRIPVDAPTRDKPFVFWLNHDQDDTDEGGETSPITVTDASTPPVDSLRDLEDLTRLRIDIDNLQDVDDSATLTLGWVGSDSGIDSGSEAPTIRLFRSADGNCSRSYLLDVEAARRQRSEPYSLALGTVAPKQPLQLSLSELGPADFDGAAFCFLLEVTSSGSGSLIAELSSQSKESVVAAPAPMHLPHVKTLDQRTNRNWPQDHRPPWEYTTTPPIVPELNWRIDPQHFPFQPGWYETDDVLVWIYGWLRSGEGQYEAATTLTGETVFKRLWHRGFRGRLIFFHWPTVKPELVYGLLESEYRAYKSAPALVNFIDQLPADKRVHVTAHSLGCALLAEAVKLGLSADGALFQVGAIPASMFDTRELLQLPDMADVVTPVTADEGGYLGYIERTNTPIYTMYNFADITFFGWNIAQKQLKPTSKKGGYRYEWNPDAAPGEQARLYYSTGFWKSDYRTVTDPHEIMSFIAKSKTHAIGAETRLQGHVRRVYDLAREPYNFHEGHVVGWTRGVQETTAFYNLILDIFNISYVSELL